MYFTAASALVALIGSAAALPASDLSRRDQLAKFKISDLTMKKGAENTIAFSISGRNIDQPISCSGSHIGNGGVDFSQASRFTRCGSSGMWFYANANTVKLLYLYQIAANGDAYPQGGNVLSHATLNLGQGDNKLRQVSTGNQDQGGQGGRFGNQDQGGQGGRFGNQNQGGRFGSGGNQDGERRMPQSDTTTFEGGPFTIEQWYYLQNPFSLGSNPPMTPITKPASFGKLSANQIRIASQYFDQTAPSNDNRGGASGGSSRFQQPANNNNNNNNAGRFGGNNNNNAGRFGGNNDPNSVRF